MSQGIVYADISKKSSTGNRSWGKTRVEHIAKAAWEIYEENNGKISFEILLSRTKEYFEASGIDPDVPHMNIHKKD